MYPIEDGEILISTVRLVQHADLFSRGRRRRAPQPSIISVYHEQKFESSRRSNTLLFPPTRWCVCLVSANNCACSSFTSGFHTADLLTTVQCKFTMFYAAFGPRCPPGCSTLGARRDVDEPRWRRPGMTAQSLYGAVDGYKDNNPVAYANSNEGLGPRQLNVLTALESSVYSSLASTTWMARLNRQHQST